MAGMFSWLTGDDTSSLGGMPDRMDAAGTPMNRGLFGNAFRDDPGAIPSNASESMFGPLTGSQKTSLLFAGLRDMVNSFGGNPPSDYLGQQGATFQRSNFNAAQKSTNEAIRKAYASGDMNAVRQAVMGAAASGMDVSHILDAVKATRPDIKDIGGVGVAIDPLTGSINPVYRAPPKAPAGYTSRPDGSGFSFVPGGPADPANRTPPSGYRWANPNHTALELIPGYIEGVGQVSGARRAPKPSANLSLPHPGSLY